MVGAFWYQGFSIYTGRVVELAMDIVWLGSPEVSVQCIPNLESFSGYYTQPASWWMQSDVWLSWLSFWSYPLTENLFHCLVVKRLRHTLILNSRFKLYLRRQSIYLKDIFQQLDGYFRQFSSVASSVPWRDFISGRLVRMNLLYRPTGDTFLRLG